MAGARAVPSGALLNNAEKTEVVLGQVAFGGVGGGNVNNMKSIRALTSIRTGTRASIDSNASKSGLEFLKGTGEDRKGGPAKDIDFEVGVKGAGFGVELG